METMNPKSRQSNFSASALILSALALGGLGGLGALGGAANEITSEERKLLASMERGARDIWRRRLYQGPSPSEREFWNEKLLAFRASQPLEEKADEPIHSGD
jgi:hypothetical protein